MVDFAMQIRKGEWIRRFSIIQIYCLALCSYKVCRDFAICIYGKLPHNRLVGQVVDGNPLVGERPNSGDGASLEPIKE